jgi:hypothetical protein
MVTDLKIIIIAQEITNVCVVTLPIIHLLFGLGHETNIIPARGHP